MTRCPNCNYQELAGAIFCSECGAQLIFPPEESARGTVVYAAPADGLEPEAPVYTAPYAAGSPQAAVSLFIIEQDVLLPLEPREELTLGRTSAGQPVVPDIDLAPYHAYECGVSRLHAALKIQDNRLSIMDLGSANGTRVNGKRIPPQKTYPLMHGDVLTLGKLKIQILVRGD